MRSFYGLSLILANTVAIYAQLLLFGPGQSDFKLADKNSVSSIVVASNELVGVARAAQDLAWDFGRVIGINATVRKVDGDNLGNSTNTPVILVGSIGHSSVVDKLISDGKLDISKVKGQWESYTSQVVRNPAPNVPWALVIAGSDRRGAIYGLYDISEQMGVSPWYWWADIPIKTKTSIYVSPAGKVQGPPSVKYRGFFINDEAPALAGWVQKNFGGTFNSDFYRLVFELCLRLKGNYLWPAMWGKMFYVDDAKNGQLAHDYGIVMGTSHHEPMARSEKEQQNYNKGDWDWNSNKENIKNFFKDGIQRAKNWETYWTMGMRGKGDAASPTLSAAALEEIIQAQQELLATGLNDTNLMDIRQTWVLYKEVSDYYAQGLKVPDSVTLLWTDDNSGNLIRVPTANESSRAAGAGVYYHFDYVGSPRSYKWINTIQLVKTWEQMHLAYNKNARQIWLVNVGDIKPLEVPLTHFMDMAYNFDRHTTPMATTHWLKRWATQEFGTNVADQIVKILSQYGILTARRKYELLSELPYAFSTINYDEAARNLAQWEDLLKLAQATHDSLDPATQVSFFQLILHPIMAGKTVVDLYTKVAFNKLYADQGRISANTVAQQAQDLFKQDAEITKRYHSLNGGKWDSFVNQAHIGYTSWDDPKNNQNIMPALRFTSGGQTTGSLGVGIQSSTAFYPQSTNLTLPSMDPYMPESEIRSFELYALKNGTISYSVSSNVSYVKFSSTNGTLVAPGENAEKRVNITVDWIKAPAGSSTVTINIAASDNSKTTLNLPVNKISIPNSFKGFVESNGVVAMEASHYTSAETKNGVSYIEIPNYGRTLSGIKPWPVTMDSQTPEDGPALKYAVYTTSSTNKSRLIVSLGASHNHDPTRPIKFAYSIDGAAAKAVKPVPTTPPYKESGDWRKAVVENGYTSTIALDAEIKSGAHELKIWLLEPGVVLQKVVLDMGGLRSSALGPLESKRV